MAALARSGPPSRRPGYLLTGTGGTYMVARVVPDGPPAILGQTRYAQERDEIWTVLSVGAHRRQAAEHRDRRRHRLDEATRKMDRIVGHASPYGNRVIAEAVHAALER